METAKKSDKIRGPEGYTLSQICALRITPARSPRLVYPENSNRYRWNGLVHGTLWKDYYFFPEAPRIENDDMLGPVNTKGEFSFRSRVLPLLNRLPTHWKDFECVYRQIESQWSLRMCNGH